MFILLLTVAAFFLGVYFYLQLPQFGKPPAGTRLDKIKQSPQYRDGKFQNQSYTPALTEGYSYAEVMYQFLFKRNPKRNPTGRIPSVKTDLLNLPVDRDVMVWFGHSSYFIQLSGKKILVDPVLSGNASPIKGSNKSFAGTEMYTADEIPNIDFLFITHDHYDHLDHQTIIKIKSKVGRIICGLGVGAHLEHWGFSASMITELDWCEAIDLGEGFKLTAAPSRHFSGRASKRNNTLWLSMILQTPTTNLYLGGDSGYDKHFKEIGEKYGPFDLALLDNGQYDVRWNLIHAMPAEVLQAAKDLKTRKLFPVHSGKFAMANHAWDDPLKTISALNKAGDLDIVTPMIGEAMNLSDIQQDFKAWWIGVD